MDEELKELLEKANGNYELVKKELEEKQSKLLEKVNNINDALATQKKENAEALELQAKNFGEQVEEVKNLLADIETKLKPQVQPVDAKKDRENVLFAIKGAIGELVKSGGIQGDKTGEATFKKLVEISEVRLKTLNLTNSGEGAESVASVLASEILKRAREAFPILNDIGRKTITRDYKQNVLISYPSVQDGIENVAGSNISETSTQKYTQVASKVAKMNAKPRITDEAMYGSDQDIFGDLIMLLDEELGRKLLAHALYGNGTGKAMRGILSSNRVDITNLTGESFKPTIDSATPANARSADHYPVLATGVSGSLGATDKAIVNYTISLKNKLPTKYRPTAKWYMNTNTMEVLEKLRDANDRPVLKDSYMTNGFALHGYPVVIDDNLPDIDADSTPIIFGDLGKAFYIDKGDIDKFLVDPYSVDGNTVVKVDQEYFEIMGLNDAIIIAACTTNALA